MNLFTVFISAVVLVMVGSGMGCAPGKPRPRSEFDLDARALFEYVCGSRAPGVGLHSVTGKVWMKATSKEASGQFPAEVEVKNSSTLLMEVTNLLGATQATIRVEGRKILVEAPDDGEGKPFKREGVDSWGGIPLAWSAPLFLGNIPCPQLNAIKDAAMSVGSDGELRVQTRASLEQEEQNFKYTFREWEGKPWAEALSWERKGTAPLKVSFLFDDPEEKTRSPKKWEAKSALGEVKVRWKKRETK